ncbi:MAG: hypothetical protein ACFB16_17280, partial [Phormidesmis sp.]
LVEGEYVLQSGNPVWMPEVGLGIGVASGKQGILPVRDWLYFYDESGQQYPTKDLVIAQQDRQLRQEKARADRAEQMAEQERQKAEQARQRFQTMLQKLRDRNIDPDTL